VLYESPPKADSSDTAKNPSVYQLDPDANTRLDTYFVEIDRDGWNRYNLHLEQNRVIHARSIEHEAIISILDTTEISLSDVPVPVREEAGINLGQWLLVSVDPASGF